MNEAMALNDLALIADTAKNLTVTAVLVVFLVGAFKGWWVPGYLYKQKCDDLDKQTSIAEQAVTLADRLSRGA